MTHRNLIVIGASAGGVEAVRQVLSGLPHDLEASVLVVLHASAQTGGLLPRIIGRPGGWPVIHPEDRTPIEYGNAYLAPPDRHLVVSGDILRVLSGPRENLHRPAIDPLFRSAAVSRGRSVIAVVLTGLLDDGTSGLIVVHAHGGKAIVQDPLTAMYPDMPRHALERVPEAEALSLEQIGGRLAELVREELPESQPDQPVRGSVEQKEVQMIEQQMPQIDDADRPGHSSGFACPDCGGVLWEVNEDRLLRYRCRVGHAFTALHLEVEQRHATEMALWSALRALEETASLYRRMADRAESRSFSFSAERFQERASGTEENARILRDFLTRVEANTSDPEPRRTN